MAWIVAIIGSIAGFLFGYDEGIIAGSLGLVKNHFNLNATHIGVMASALPFGALFGSLLICIHGIKVRKTFRQTFFIILCRFFVLCWSPGCRFC